MHLEWIRNFRNKVLKSHFLVYLRLLFRKHEQLFYRQMLIIILTIWERNETNNTALKYNFEVFSESVLLKFVMFLYRKQPIQQLQFRGSTLTSPQINRRVKNFQVKLSFISLNTMSHKSVEFGLGIGNIEIDRLTCWHKKYLHIFEQDIANLKLVWSCVSFYYKESWY